jgi:catechol 2,3-dioxygenase
MADQFLIHPDTNLGAVHLTVSDLERALRFYTEALGFGLGGRQDGAAWLTADGTTPLLVLTEQPGARPKPARSTGLYHFAVLLPGRVELARWLRHMLDAGHPLQGASDHLVSEAIYLADPDGNGIEMYADRPREAWPRRDGQLQMATEALDGAGLLAELEADNRPWNGLPSQTRIGHIHLHVADLRRAEAFYCDTLGFERVTTYGASALFVSAGGYHHHIGLNTWAGVGAPPSPPDSAGLRFFTVRLPDRAELERAVAHLQASGAGVEQEEGAVFVQDPSGNRIHLVANKL